MRRFIVLLTVVTVVFWGSVAGAAMTSSLTYTAEGAGISIDALGTDSTGIISAYIPVGAEIYAAYLYSASVWDGGLANVTFQGNTLVSSASSRLDMGVKQANNASENRWDVTSIVKSVVGSGSGLFDFNIAEDGYLDGEILAVVYKVPTKALNTVFIFDGELANGGDSFKIDLTKPVDKTDPDYQATLSLGISFGYQTADFGNQQTNVDVNGIRMTSSAGGQDDGYSGNGGLITAGGLGDDPFTHPDDPYALVGPEGFRNDDELYSLNDFINNGDTSISFKTNNPSFDDNVFFASLTTLGKAQTHDVPEPATLLLLGLGLVGFAGAKKALLKK